MHIDVEVLKTFYATPLGTAVRRVLTHRVRARWRGLTGQTVIGLGYPCPYLGVFNEEAHAVVALMPAQQGALVWPRTGPVQSALVMEEQLPLADNSVDRLLAVHCLEVAERPAVLLREIWRVLAPEGRLLLLVPNRRGLWARFDATPFGYGRPYSRSQLERLLNDALLTPFEWKGALHMPPLGWSMIVRSAPAWERLGARLSPAFGGVMMVEARKEVMAPLAHGVPARSFGRLVTLPG